MINQAHASQHRRFLPHSYVAHAQSIIAIMDLNVLFQTLLQRRIQGTGNPISLLDEYHCNVSHSLAKFQTISNFSSAVCAWLLLAVLPPSTLACR